jgi:hypothetical protein
MQLEELVNGIIHIHYDTQEGLTRAFLRPQECFESPEFRGKVFTLDEFKKWYIANSPKGKSTGEFTYFTDWNGFNVPGDIIERLFNGEFDPTSEDEEALLNVLEPYRGRKFYVLGTHAEKKTTSLRHEIAHGLFYTNKDYRREVLAVVDEYVDQEDVIRLHNFFRDSAGYHESVFEDEVHAHVLASQAKLEKNSIDFAPYQKAHEELNRIFDRYYSP